MPATPFTVAQASEAGASCREPRRREVVTLSRGIKTLKHDGGNPLALLTRRCTLGTGYSAATDATAFAMWQMRGFLPGSDGETIHSARRMTVEELVMAADHLIGIPRQKFQGRTEPC